MATSIQFNAKELNAHIYIALSEPRTHCQKNPYKSLKETLKKISNLCHFFSSYILQYYDQLPSAVYCYTIYTAALSILFFTHTHTPHGMSLR